MVVQQGRRHPVETSLEIQTGYLTNTGSLVALSLAGQEKQAGGIHSEQTYLDFTNWRNLNLNYPSYSMTLSNLICSSFYKTDCYSALCVEFLGGSNEICIEEILRMHWHIVNTQ